METERLVEAINKDKGKGQTQTILDKVVDFLDETGEVRSYSCLPLMD